MEISFLATNGLIPEEIVDNDAAAITMFDSAPILDLEQDTILIAPGALGTKLFFKKNDDDVEYGTCLGVF